MADQLAAQRPADRLGRRIGAEQFAEPVLLLARRGQMSLKLRLQHLMPGQVMLGGQAAVAADRGGQLPEHPGQPGAHLRVLQRVVVAT
jgi:hypothetical protein